MTGRDQVKVDGGPNNLFYSNIMTGIKYVLLYLSWINIASFRFDICSICILADDESACNKLQNNI